MTTIIIRSAASLLIVVVLLFVPAGRIDWLRGWLFLGILAAFVTASALYLRRVNPEIFIARRRIHPGTKRWDRILLIFLLGAMMAILPVAGLDDGRFGWSRMSWWYVGLGYVLLTAGMLGTTWAQAVNKFFEPGVRLQTDRGHHVVDTGPYAIVRHPGYTSAFLLMAGMALALGSWWALIPAGLAAALLVLRIVWEDRMLHDELPGYADYVHRVRYRLLPAVW